MPKHTVHSPNKSGRETPSLTALSLFAGVGGFDLGFERAGIRVIAQCEIDPHAASVLRRHWPDVPVVSDVTTLNGAEYVADVITGGFPCQDLSVAGKRAGLDGERSGLFFEIVRIVHEMREATDGQYPRWVVLENVVGAYSSNGGADFAAVLESLVGGEVRRPTSGWANAGVAFGPLGSAEWRTLDSQYFGVPQRRRRIFLVYHPGGVSAGEVLLEPDGVPGDPPSRRSPGEGITGALTGGAGSSSAGNVDDNRAQAGFVVSVVTGTLTVGANQTYGFPGEAAPVAFVASDYSTGAYEAADKAEALTASADRTRAAPLVFAANQGDEVRDLGGRSGALQADPGMKQQTFTAAPYAVRRLTPKECERLQGFPDGWTAHDHEGREIADTHRYRMMGNAVTVPVAEWIARRLKEALS